MTFLLVYAKFDLLEGLVVIGKNGQLMKGEAMHKQNGGSCLFLVVGSLLFVPLLLWGGLRLYNWIIFGIECTGHLKRAADANTVELAKQEMATAIQYLEKNGFTSGYTSIIYRTPDADVGFWYTNLKAALGELEVISSDATQLEKTNVLMKLRETLLDQGEKGVNVTVPGGMSVFPHNVGYCWLGVFGLIFTIIGIVLWVIGCKRWSGY